MASSRNHQLFLGTGSGIVHYVQHFKGNKTVPISVNEEGGRGGTGHSRLAIHLVKGIVGLQLGQKGGDRQQGKTGEAEYFLQLVGEFRCHIAVAAVGNGRLHVGGQIGGTSCQHGGGRSHGDTVDQDTGIRLHGQNAGNPPQHIVVLQPAHADVPPLTVPMGSMVGNHYVPACIVIVAGIVGHAGGASLVAVHQQGVLVCGSRSRTVIAHQLQSIVADDGLPLTGGNQPFLRCLRDVPGHLLLRQGLHLFLRQGSLLELGVQGIGEHVVGTENQSGHHHHAQ